MLHVFGTARCSVCAAPCKEIRCKAGRFKTYSPGAALYLLLCRLILCVRDLWCVTFVCSVLSRACLAFCREYTTHGSQVSDLVESWYAVFYNVSSSSSSDAQHPHATQSMSVVMVETFSHEPPVSLPVKVMRAPPALS